MAKPTLKSDMLSHTEAQLLRLDLPYAQAVRKYQAYYITQAVRQSNSMPEVAEKLGLHRENLYRMMERLNIKIPARFPKQWRKHA